jgi:hypothetical protein
MGTKSVLRQDEEVEMPEKLNKLYILSKMQRDGDVERRLIVALQNIVRDASKPSEHNPFGESPRWTLDQVAASRHTRTT